MREPTPPRTAVWALEEVLLKFLPSEKQPRRCPRFLNVNGYLQSDKLLRSRPKTNMHRPLSSGDALLSCCGLCFDAFCFGYVSDVGEKRRGPAQMGMTARVQQQYEGPIVSRGGIRGVCSFVCCRTEAHPGLLSAQRPHQSVRGCCMCQSRK